MKEARIECVVVGGYPINDLGLKLHKNQVVWHAADAAKKSKDLKLARQLGAVQVRYEERCRVAKKLPDPKRHVPPSVRQSRPGRAVPAPPPEPRKAEIDMEEVARRAEVAAANASERAVDRAMAKLTAQPGISQGMLEDALRNVLGSGGIQMAPSSAKPSASPPQAVDYEEEDDAEPVFIPKGIVPTNAKATISTETETAKAEGLDAAAAALKAARPKRTRKKT